MKINKLHVMHVVESLDVGGMENGVVNLANKINKDQFKISICCLSQPGVLRERISDENILVIDLKWSGGFKPKLIFLLARIFKEQKVDIVHTHGWLSLIYSSLAAILARIPVVINGEHGTFHLEKKRRKIAYALISFMVDIYIPVSFSLELELKHKYHINSSKIITIPNGVDAVRFSPKGTAEITRTKTAIGIPETALVIGSAGRLEPVKNYEMIIYAFSEINKSFLDSYCILIGDGSQRSKLESLAKELGINNKVLFMGNVDNVDRLLPILDIFVLTSLSEGMSNTVLEAMSSGKPIIATNVGDNNKLVKDGYNGFLVESGDVKSLTNTIIYTLNNHDKCTEMGNNSRSIVIDRYDIDKMILYYEKVYHNSINAKRHVK